MSRLDCFLEQSSALHKHLCPRQVLGARMGVYAADLFGVELPQDNKRFYAFVETDGCFADGVSVATGCWLGRRTMRLMDYGRVAVTIVDTESEHAIRFWPHPQARCRALTCAPDAQSRWHAQLAAYQIMPTEELLCAAPVALTVSLAALISRPGVRTMCEQCGEEILNERAVLVEGHTLCRSCAGDSYYLPQPGSAICTAHHKLMVVHTI
ncbi:MAG: TraR/DksA C4-type zinc finger protein [Anaerolineae bacterium]|nr:TraR/DksA C4-type zinc finger protein [Anaerolineae bacterium]